MKNDFAQGNIARNILAMAVPMTTAQLVNILYNLVDRIYIGHLPNSPMEALSGLGLCLPIITIVIAFANLFGMGGSALCSIERGRGNLREAELLMGNSFVLLLGTSILLTIGGLLFKRPLLYLFGASDALYSYAASYLNIYLMGNVFVMLGLGMNAFINSQGFGRIGMMTVLLGAVSNLVLDPIFIFVFKMGVRGAALATVLSQLFSVIWIIRFLTGEQAIIRLGKCFLRLTRERAWRIVCVGFPGFIAGFTNSLVAMACNATLQTWGGDLYVGVMTVLYSVREIGDNVVQGITGGARPVIGYNYGAGKYGRVMTGIYIMTGLTCGVCLLLWGLVSLFPERAILIFNDDPALLAYAVPALHVYFFGYFMMALQSSGQSAFVSLGKAKHATFFSLFRKVVIVVPLTILLPYVGGLGTMGVFLAEAISNFVGGGACYLTMLVTLRREFAGNAKISTIPG